MDGLDGRWLLCFGNWRGGVLVSLAAAAVLLAGCANRPGGKLPDSGPETRHFSDGHVSGGTGREAEMPAPSNTPLGQYERMMLKEIGTRWYREIEMHKNAQRTNSEVRLHFHVTRSGRVRAVRVSKGDPGSALAVLSIRVLSEVKLPPIPPTVSDVLPRGELDVGLGFQFYVNE